MKISTFPDGDRDWEETYNSFEEVEKDLAQTATDDYHETVMTKLRSGEIKFTIANGPDTDVWEVVP